MLKYKIDPESIWFQRHDLPIAMTPNEDVKDIVRNTLPEGEYDIHGSTIVTLRTNLMTLYHAINQYFNEFQQ